MVNIPLTTACKTGCMGMDGMVVSTLIYINLIILIAVAAFAQRLDFQVFSS